MAWSHFTTPTLSWTVARSSHPDVTATQVLRFVGRGDGSAGSKMTSSSGDWERAEYIGGSGTESDPDIVNLSCKGTSYYIKRSGSKLACHPGTATLKKPLGEDDDGGEGTKPIWEAQEGG